MALQVLTISDSSNWDAVVKSFPNHDVYYLSGYAKAFQVHDDDDGEPLLIYYTNGTSRAIQVVMKRDVAGAKRLHGKVEPGKYYDFTTPYGYGGFIWDGTPDWKGLDAEYTEYCKNEGIVSEFVRFHPLEQNRAIFERYYNPEFNRKTVCVDLVGDDAMTLITAKCRNMVRKAQKNEVQIQFDFDCRHIDDFFRIYTLSMDKKSATPYYYFDKRFFSEMANKLQRMSFFVHAIVENEVIASAMFLYSDRYVHYHFSGTDPNYYHLAPTNLIIASVIQWGIEEKKSKLHLGGGHTTAIDDSLLAFKKSFSKGGLCDFFIGKKIHNRSIYDKLCEESLSPLESGFFPLYRTP